MYTVYYISLQGWDCVRAALRLFLLLSMLHNLPGQLPMCFCRFRPPDEVVATSLMCCCFGRSPFDSRNRKQFGSTLPSSSRWQDVKIECSHPITRSTLTESIATLEPGDKHMESQGTLKSSMPLFSLAINHSWMFLALLKRSLRHRPKYSETESWSSQMSYILHCIRIWFPSQMKEIIFSTS